VIFFIGLATLPDDLDTWGNRLRDVWESAGDNPIAAGAIVAGLILIGLGNWDRLSRLILSRKRWRSDKELETELRDWLTEAGFTLEVPPLTPEISKEASFVFAATMLKRPVTVVRPLNAPGIRLLCVVKPDPPHDAVIRAMDADEKSSLNEELGIELARFGLGFSLEDVLGLGVVIDYPILVTDRLFPYQLLMRHRRRPKQLHKVSLSRWGVRRLLYLNAIWAGYA